MGPIQSSILTGLAVMSGVSKAQEIKVNQEANLELKKQHLAIEKQIAETKQQREERMQEESASKTAYYSGKGYQAQMQGQILAQDISLRDIAISALQRAQKRKETRMDQRKIMREIKKIKEL